MTNIHVTESDLELPDGRRLKALDRALYDELRVTVAGYDPAFTDAGPPPVRGTGPAVKLVERPDETPAAPGSAQHEEWDAATVKVTAKNTADFKVTGAQLKGEVGDTVPLVVKFTNAGPGWVLREIGAGATRVHIEVPAGAGRYVGRQDRRVLQERGVADVRVRHRPGVGRRKRRGDVRVPAEDRQGGVRGQGLGGARGLASTGTGSVLPLTAAAAGAVILGTGTVLVIRRRAGRRH
ncbi:hypothetical protein [Streptomyces sp. NPDC001165]|uniref:hypothetical protein n=1 Tax=Streptomyces sp. NPDC001165 TaxID=3364546 RepID=UPI00368D664A